MSCKSSSSKGRVDPEVLLEDIEDLDYEPDLVEELEDDSSLQVPEPSGQEFQDWTSNPVSSGRQSLSYGTDLDRRARSNIKSFRDKMNYMNLHVDVERSSCRSQFIGYSSVSGSNHLDSSEEEDIEPEFSDGDDEENDFDVSMISYRPGDDEKCFDEQREPIEDPNYIGPNSPEDSQLCYEEEYESESLSYQTNSPDEESIGLSFVGGQIDNVTSYRERPMNNDIDKESMSANENDSDAPKPKNKSLNFKIQVKSDQRIVIDPVVEEKKPRPWESTVDRYLRRIIPLSSLDEVVKYCPLIESWINNNSPSLDGSESVSRSLKSDSTKGSLFKIPLKRPPAKQKSSLKNISVSVREKGLVTVKQTEDNSDILSLIASTNIMDDHEESETSDNAPVKSEPLSIPGSIESAGASKMHRVAEWVQNTKFPKVPAVYKGLCFNYFFNDNCRIFVCKKSHLLQTKIERISQLSEEELSEAYSFAKSNPIFYAKIYKVFADIFGSKDNKRELVNMVHVLFDPSVKVSKAEGLKTVLENLQRTDLGTFEDSVDYILLEVGLKTIDTLGESLLEVIVSMGNLTSRWPLLRKLFITGVKVPLRLAQRFLVNLTRQPVDQKVCQEVYQHILKYQCLDLPLVPINIRESFLKLSTLSDHQRVSDTEEESTVERTPPNLVRENDSNMLGVDSTLNIPTDFSVPPPNFRAFGRVEPAAFRGSVASSNPLAASGQAPSYVSQTESGVNLGGQQDFATLSRHQPSLTPSVESDSPSGSPFNPPTYNSGVPMRFVSRPPPTHNLNRTRSNSPEGSDSLTSTRVTDSQASTVDQSANYLNQSRFVNQPANIGYSTVKNYNSAGFHYDPADYVPPSKRRHVDTSNFDLSESSNPAVDVNYPQFDRLRDSGGPSGGDNYSYQQMVATRDYQMMRQMRPVPRTNDALVSSSSDLMLQRQKPPEHPEFGTFYFDPNYEFNVSLHNLYLERIYNVDIDEDDVFVLNDCVKTGNGRGFLDLIDKYKNPQTVQNFISMTLAHLKGMNQMVAGTYKKLLASIEKHNPSFYGNLKIRVILEVITMNLLFELEKRNKFNDARDLLLKFSNWDSLITSRLFITDTRIGVSIVGRYLFIAKILVFTKPELTYEILNCPTLHFLEDYQKWPYHPSCPIPEIFSSDLEARNIVLLNFLKRGYLLNPVVVTQLYKIALKRRGGIWSFDVKPHIDPMIVDLLNRNQIVSLKQINSEIGLFFKYMEKDTLRAFLGVMCKHLNKMHVFALFEKCCARNIYQRLVKEQVLEHTIEIKTNMLPGEIEVIILYYFHKLGEMRSLPPGNEPLRFQIKLPGEFLNKNLSMLQKNRSILEVKEIIKEFLWKRCSIDCKFYVSNVVEVEKGELIRYLEELGPNRVGADLEEL